MLKLPMTLFLLVFTSVVSAENAPEITAWDKTVKLLEGFDDLSVDVFVNEEAKKCYVQEKMLLTKTLLAVAQTRIRVEEDGTKADAVLMVGVESTTQDEGRCVSNVSLRLYGLATASFEKAALQKYAMVPLFEEYKLVESKSLTHSERVESTTDELLRNFVFKWNYFNNPERAKTNP